MQGTYPVENEQDCAAVQEGRSARHWQYTVCLLSAISMIFTQVILNKIRRTLDEGQPCEEEGFRKKFSTNDYIHTVMRLIKVSVQDATMSHVHRFKEGVRLR